MTPAPPRARAPLDAEEHTTRIPSVSTDHGRETATGTDGKRTNKQNEEHGEAGEGRHARIRGGAVE